MAQTIRFWTGMTVLGLLVIFTIQNVTVVEVTFLLWTLKLPRAILLFLVFAAGTLCGWLFSRWHRPPVHPDETL
ncbi:MAG: LapA family protein [Alphaproteobacteria bacterium]|nr:LapA family protein [Alphaproteobacteria bacterium]